MKLKAVQRTCFMGPEDILARLPSTDNNYSGKRSALACKRLGKEEMDTNETSTGAPLFWRAGAGILLITLGLIIMIVWAGPAAQEPDAEMIPTGAKTLATDPAGPKGAEQTNRTGGNREFGEPLPKGVLPTRLEEAPLRVRDAYSFASNPDNRELMQSLTCYCGCSEGLDHTSLYHCYVEEVLPEGLIAYGSHGIGCSTCLEEAWDADALQQEGKTMPEIKELIDSKYGPSTWPPADPAATP